MRSVFTEIFCRFRVFYRKVSKGRRDTYENCAVIRPLAYLAYCGTIRRGSRSRSCEALQFENSPRKKYFHGQFRRNKHHHMFKSIQPVIDKPQSKNDASNLRLTLLLSHARSKSKFLVHQLMH